MSEEDKSTWSLRCGARLGMRTRCSKDNSAVLLVISGGHAQRPSSAAMKTYVLKVFSFIVHCIQWYIRVRWSERLVFTVWPSVHSSNKLQWSVLKALAMQCILAYDDVILEARASTQLT